MINQNSNDSHVEFIKYAGLNFDLMLVTQSSNEFRTSGQTQMKSLLIRQRHIKDIWKQLKNKFIDL